MDTGTQASGKTAADVETLIIVRRRHAKKRGKRERKRASAFVYSCPVKIWDALVWNCQMSGEHPTKAMKDALAAYLKERGWREPPPATAGQPAPDAQKPGVR